MSALTETITQMVAETQPMAISEAREGGICAVDLHSFLAYSLPPREMLIEPFLPMQGLAMVYAFRGAGKTWLTLELAYMVASGGSFLNWKAPHQRKVLVIDGEMPAVTLQERLALITASHELEAEQDMLRIINPEMQDIPMPNLSTTEGQEAIAEDVEWADFIIVDNLSTLCRSGRENEGESWLPVQEWALNLRRRGKSVLFVHHANKGGGQRGSIRKEDVLDTVIALRKPQDYDGSDGARFEVHFEKHRGFHGKDASPFEAQLISGNGDVLHMAAIVRFGWTVADVFGCHPTHPQQRYDCMGLLLMMAESEVISVVDEKRIGLQHARTGRVLFFTKRTNNGEGVMVWQMK